MLALIGPSGCGKTTLLRSLNRLVDLTPTAMPRAGESCSTAKTSTRFDVTHLRRRVGMLFQQPNPFPMSIFDNVAYGLRERGSKRPSRRELEPAVVEALHRAGLFEEVKDNLDHPALALSGGQQQRLCIARSLAVRPEVLLLDEPCSALDPISTAVIEETIVELRTEVAIVIVTHNLQQAQRVADHVAFMYLGDLVEYGEASRSSARPRPSAPASTSAGASGEPAASHARRPGAARAARSAACQSTQERAPSWKSRVEELLSREGAEDRAGRAATSRSVSTSVLSDANGSAVVGRAPQRLRTGAGRRPDLDRRPRRQGQERLQERHPRARAGAGRRARHRGPARAVDWVNDQVLAPASRSRSR